MILQSSLDAARASASVHYVLRHTPPSGVTIGDVSGQDGRQWIRVPKGGRIEVRLVSNIAYSLGNRAGYVMAAGLSSRSAARLAGTWASVTPSLGVIYRAIVDQVTLASVLAYVTPTGTLTESADAHVFGTPAIKITGGQPQALLSNPASAGTGALFLSRSGAHLPIAFKFSYHGYNGQPESELWRLTSWGKPFTVTAPRHPKPFVAVLRSTTGQA